MPSKPAVAALLAVVTVLPSCAGTPSGATSDGGRSWEYRCPPAGTTVRDSRGGRVTYLGEAGPGLCRRSDGQTAIYGLWFVPRGQQPSPEIQAWLAGLFPARTGRRATAQQLGPSVSNPRDSQMWLREARVVGFETLDLPAGRLDTVLIEWEDRGMVSNYHRSLYRRWLDTRTGATVRSERRLLSGSGSDYAWHAMSIHLSNPAAQTAEQDRVAPAALQSREAGASVSPPSAAPPRPIRQPARQVVDPAVMGRTGEVRQRELQDLRAGGLLSQDEDGAAR